MTRTVWKFPIPITDYMTLNIPKGAVLLTCVTLSHRDLALYALVDPEAPLEKRHFRLAGTGHDIEEAVHFIGTFVLLEGRLVYHLFELDSWV